MYPLDSTWVFPKIGIPQNGWFIMEIPWNPYRNGWFGGSFPPIFRKHPHVTKQMPRFHKLLQVPKNPETLSTQELVVVAQVGVPGSICSTLMIPCWVQSYYSALCWNSIQKCVWCGSLVCGKGELASTLVTIGLFSLSVSLSLGSALRISFKWAVYDDSCSGASNGSTEMLRCNWEEWDR